LQADTVIIFPFIDFLFPNQARTRAGAHTDKSSMQETGGFVNVQATHAAASCLDKIGRTGVHLAVGASAYD
jgi:hypothetical protein